MDSRKAYGTLGRYGTFLIGASLVKALAFMPMGHAQKATGF